ncbi:mitochondrial import inner membrane translocase subunit TIM44-2 [Lolium perenne]|uniref:mitochondrial import inner membrane translocase subunit TIM44-2 n=1 Tax=Lolium perenne TaxID=4522 RepID=UPI0021F5ECBF|nr:mitochondrial import inner membrane translocase subunit TIM44-2 isoform X1 [Lolium perenne]
MATSALLRALRRPSSVAALRLATNGNAQALSGYRHLNNRNLSVFNEFSKQLKGEANSNPEFQKSMKEFSEKLGVVKEDLKVRTKKTAETVSKSVDDVLAEAEATSKKVTANVKEKISAATEEVKESFGLGKEETSSFTEGSAGTSKHGKTEASSHSDDKSQDATSSYILFNKLRSTLSAASPVVSGAFAKLRDTRVSTLAKQGYEIVKDELSSGSSRKKKNLARRASAAVEKSTRTEIVFVPTKKSVLGEKWEALKNKMQGHPVYKRVNKYTKPVVTKGQEVAEDVRERWETSDHPVVQKIQDINETIFEETATAESFKEIRRRDPSFSLSDFLGDVQDMIKPVLTGYSKGDVKTLKKYCTKEMLERCTGERNAYATQGMFFDHKILHISDADVKETKMLGSAPIILVVFQTQEIHCIRDREGEVTEGGQDTIRTVYYQWAMQLMDSDEVPEEESYYAVWRLRDMQAMGVKALI